MIGKGKRSVYIISQDTGFDSIVDFWRGRNIEAFRQPSIASPSTPKDVSLKGTSTRKEEKIGSRSPKNQKKRARKGKKETKIVEKRKPEKKKLSGSDPQKNTNELKDEKLPAGKYTSIYKAVEESENKLALNNALVKTFDTSIGLGSTITSKKFMRITRGNPHFLFKVPSFLQASSHCLYKFWETAPSAADFFSQPRLDGISRTVIKIDKPVFVSGIPGRRRCFLDPVTAHFCKIFAMRRAPSGSSSRYFQ